MDPAIVIGAIVVIGIVAIVVHTITKKKTKLGGNVEPTTGIRLPKR